MNSLWGTRQGVFEPMGRAVSDSALQIRARPGLFLLIWLSLSIAPLLILASLFLQPLKDAIAELMNLYNLIVSGSDPFALTDDFRRLFWRYVGIILLLSGLLLVTSTYAGSVLFSTVSRFRSRETPTYWGALREGVSQYAGLFAAVMLCALRMFLFYVAGSFLGSIIGLFLGDLMYIPMIVTSLSLFAGLQRYGLSPFINLATGVSGRNAIRVSKAFFLTERPTVSGFFLAGFLIPTILLFSISSLVFRINSVLGRYTAGLLLGLFQFTFTIVTINFAMNNFHRYRGGEEVRETTAIDAH